VCPKPPDVEGDREYILFAGWRRDLRDILLLLDVMCVQGSEVHIMAGTALPYSPALFSSACAVLSPCCHRVVTVLSPFCRRFVAVLSPVGHCFATDTTQLFRPTVLMLSREVGTSVRL